MIDEHHGHTGTTVHDIVISEVKNAMARNELDDDINRYGAHRAGLRVIAGEAGPDETIPDHFTFSPVPGVTYEINFAPEDKWLPRGSQKSWRRGTWG